MLVLGFKGRPMGMICCDWRLSFADWASALCTCCYRLGPVRAIENPSHLKLELPLVVWSVYGSFWLVLLLELSIGHT